MNWLITKTRKNAPDTVPDAQCRGRSRFPAIYFSLGQGTVHKVTLHVLRSRENLMCSVEMFTGQHTPYTFPIITEQCNVYSLIGKLLHGFHNRLIQKGGFLPYSCVTSREAGLMTMMDLLILWAYLTVFPVPLGHPFHTARI